MKRPSEWAIWSWTVKRPSTSASTLAKHGAAQRRAQRDAMTERLRMAVRAGYVSRIRSRDEVVAGARKGAGA